MILFFLAACAVESDPCANDGALATCVTPTETDAWYVDQAVRYFDTLETAYEGGGAPNYAETVARWEWPPWLLLTGWGREDMETVDAIIRLIPTTVPDRDCRAFAEQPFARCRVSFAFEDHPGQLCPIYEEFTFDAEGEMTFIEAWSDLPGLLPTGADDPWAEGADVRRLATKLPGLGNPRGEIDLDSPWMAEAAANDADVAEFVRRARDFYGTWLETYQESGAGTYGDGCGF